MPPLVSLIIPVFNGEKTLPHCLASVFAQTFANFECIVVNDGSADGTQALLERFAHQDPRLRLLTVSNGGASRAKNLALARAKGAFWAFLDADDALEPHALEILHRLIEDTGADVAVGHIAFENEAGALLPNSPALPAATPQQPFPWRLSPGEAAQTVFRGEPFAGHLHGKMLRAERFEGLLYCERYHIYEDMLFLLEALCKSKSVAYTPTLLYHYHVTGDGAMSSSLTARKASSLRACKEMEGIANLHFPMAQSAAERFTFQNALWLLQELAAAPLATRSQFWAKEARAEALGVIRRYALPKNLPPVQQLFCGSLRLGWPLFLGLYRGPYLLTKRLTAKPSQSPPS